jgi:hypothetical protein
MQSSLEKSLVKSIMLAYFWRMGTRFAIRTKEYPPLSKAIDTGKSFLVKIKFLNSLGTVKSYVTVLRQAAKC